MNVIKLGKYILKNIIKTPIATYTSYVKDVKDFFVERDNFVLENYSDGEIFDLYVISALDSNESNTVLLAFQRQQEEYFFLMRSQYDINKTVLDLSEPNIVINHGNLQLFKIF